MSKFYMKLQKFTSKFYFKMCPKILSQNSGLEILPWKYTYFTFLFKIWALKIYLEILHWKLKFCLRYFPQNSALKICLRNFALKFASKFSLRISIFLKISSLNMPQKILLQKFTSKFCLENSSWYHLYIFSRKFMSIFRLKIFSKILPQNSIPEVWLKKFCLKNLPQNFDLKICLKIMA